MSIVDAPRPATIADVFLHRPFLLLWSALLVSSSGTVLFLIVLAGRVFDQSGSALRASSVFTAQWLLPLAFAGVTGRVCSRFCIRNVLVLAELGSGVVSLLCAFAFDHSFALVFGLLMLRGFLEGLTAPSRVVALKQYVDGRLLEKASSIFGTSRYLSSAVGSIIGAALAERTSLVGIAAIDVASFVIAASLYGALGARPAASARQDAGSWAMALQTFRAHPAVLRNSLYLFIVCGAFQGFHNVAKTVLPMRHLVLGITGMTYLQLVTSAGLFLGAVFVYRFMTSSGQRSVGQHPVALVIATAIAAPLPLLTTHPTASFGLYFLYIFLFEVAYTRIDNAIVVESPAGEIGYVSAINMSMLTTSMALVIWVAGFFTDRFGLLRVAVGIGMLAVLLALWVLVSLGRKRG